MAIKTTELSKAKSSVTKLNTKIRGIKKSISALKKKDDPKGKNGGVVKALVKKQNAAQKEKDKKAAALKKKRSDEEQHKDNILTTMKSDARFSKDSYIMPNYPRSDESYVFIFVGDESEPHSTNVATQSIENGVNIATTTQMNAPTISITGVLGGETVDDIDSINKDLVKLKRWADHGTDLRWNSKAGYQGHVIMSDFTPEFDRTGTATGINACSVTFTLTIVTYFDSNVKKKKKATASKGTKSTKKAKTSKKKSTHKYIVAKSGYTYWYVSQKTGVKLSKIEKLNKYAAKKIPIGAKIYYS